MLPRRILIITTAFVAGLSLSVAAPASAHTARPGPTPRITVLTRDVESAYNLEVRKGSVLVADSGFPGLIGRVRPDGTVETLIDTGADPSGIALSRNGRYLAYTYLTGGGPPYRTLTSGLKIAGPGGVTVTADAFAYENVNNPDRIIEYGVGRANATPCVLNELMKVTLAVYYNGHAESRPRSVAAYGKDFILVDSAANTLLRITNSGTISTLAVLPPQPVTLTAAFAAEHALADCVVGLTFNLEAAPSDVEVGADGFLYVTTTTWTPFNLDVGGRGSVYRVDPSTGKAELLASGLAEPTNLALSGGNIYITEHGAGRISVLKHGKVSEYLPLPGAVSIEARHGSLYVGTDFTGPGSIVRIDTRKGGRR